jgi:hypothetical protein
MSQNLEVKVQAIFDKESDNILNQKLKSYNLGKEFNYAVAVLRLSITNSENDSKDSLTINLIPKVQYVAPFVTKKLAQAYIEELSGLDKLIMFLPVENGKIVVKKEDIDNALENINNANQNSEISTDMSVMSYINLLASNWNEQTEECKEEVCFKLGGVKNCQYFKDMIDNWKF